MQHSKESLRYRTEQFDIKADWSSLDGNTSEWLIGLSPLPWLKLEKFDRFIAYVLKKCFD